MLFGGVPLQYAYHALQLLAELAHERGTVDAQRLPIMLEGIAALIDMGMRCAAQAHLRMQWQQARTEVELPVSPD